MPRIAKPARLPSGNYRIRWVDAHGYRRSAVYPTYREAESALRIGKTEAERGRRADRLAKMAPKRFAEICDYWLERRAPRKRSRAHDRSIIERHLRPAFGSLLIEAIGVEQVDDFVAERSHLHPKTVSNHVTLLITLLRLARDLRWIRDVPAIKKPKFDHLGGGFRYLCTKEEVQCFLRAARQHGEDVFALYATAIHTGMRAGELAGLRWDDIDLERRLITVQRSFSGPTKSGRIRHVPILDDGFLRILREWRVRVGGRIVFPNRVGAMLQPSARIFQEVLHEVLRDAGFREKRTPRGRVERHITFHGLRHTFASHFVMGGGDIFRLQKYLGHQSIVLTQRYAHLAPDAYAVDRGRLEGLLPAMASNVTAIGAK